MNLPLQEFSHNFNTPFSSNAPPKTFKAMFSWLLLTLLFMCVDTFTDARVEESLMYLFGNIS